MLPGKIISRITKAALVRRLRDTLFLIQQMLALQVSID